MSRFWLMSANFLTATPVFLTATPVTCARSRDVNGHRAGNWSLRSGMPLPAKASHQGRRRATASRSILERRYCPQLAGRLDGSLFVYLHCTPSAVRPGGFVASHSGRSRPTKNNPAPSAHAKLARSRPADDKTCLTPEARARLLARACPAEPKLLSSGLVRESHHSISRRPFSRPGTKPCRSGWRPKWIVTISVFQEKLLRQTDSHIDRLIP